MSTGGSAIFSAILGADATREWLTSSRVADR